MVWGEKMKHILRCHEIVKTDFARGQNCYLYDAQGMRYIDFESGIWCTALGHCHPRISRVMHAQMDRLIHVGTRYPNSLAENAATEILGIVGIPDGKCIFLSSGSEAVEFAVQAARRVTDKPLLLALADSYLAAYGSAGMQSADEWYRFEWSVCAACPHGDECDPECPILRNIPFERVGGFVFEPGSASGQVKFPPKPLVQYLANRVKEQRGTIVVNEVTTGMGRTGKWFGFQHYGLEPDMVALGKGLGNGYPVSAVAMAQSIATQLENHGFHYAQSHQNDPLGCAIASEVITVLREEKLIERSRRIGIRFQEGLRQLGARYPIVADVRGRGLMLALQFENRRGMSAATIYRELLDEAFLVGYYPTANLLRFDPALTIAEEDIALLLEKLKQILENKSR